MEAFKAILGRRSIRKFLDKEIEPDLEKKLLQAGMAAPSAHNRQPWHFIVVRDKDLLTKVPEYHQYSKMLPEASLGIIVCGDNKLQETDFWIQDCSAATENILIAAHALGLGTVWLGVYPVETLVTNTRELFGIPSHVTPLGIIAVGYPGQEKPPADRYNAERVHRETW